MPPAAPGHPTGPYVNLVLHSQDPAEKLTGYACMLSTGRAGVLLLRGPAPRHGAVVRVKSGFTKEGKLVARWMQAYYNSGAYAAFKPGPAATVGGGRGALGAYDIPVARGEVTWASLRSAIYAAFFLLVMLVTGLVGSWWALLALRTARVGAKREWRLTFALLALPALAQEKFSGSNVDTRIGMAFKVSDAALQKLVPPGWEVSPPTSGPSPLIRFRA